jgi:hypothetical protein
VISLHLRMYRCLYPRVNLAAMKVDLFAAA